MDRTAGSENGSSPELPCAIRDHTWRIPGLVGCASPILIGVMHWGRSIDDWEPPVKDSIYYEALRMGNRVRREYEGQSESLLEWTGDSLELAIREMSCGDDRLG